MGRIRVSRKRSLSFHDTSGSIQFSHTSMSSSLWPPWTTALQASLAITNSRSFLKVMSIDQWYHPTISISLNPFSSCLQFFPASGSLLMSQLLASGGQSIGVSASASVLPMNIQDWVPLGLTDLISLQSKGLSTVFSSTIVEEPEKQRSQRQNCQYLLDHRKC